MPNAHDLLPKPTTHDRLPRRLNVRCSSTVRRGSVVTTSVSAFVLVRDHG